MLDSKIMDQLISKAIDYWNKDYEGQDILNMIATILVQEHKESFESFDKIEELANFIIGYAADIISDN